jgi:hypothetical protein
MPVARLIQQGGIGNDKFQIDLIGDKNGVNLVYTLPDKFEPSALRIYLNGVRQMRRNGSCDYSIAESGGAGTGFDTVAFVDRPPRADDNLFADYRVAT